MEVGNSAALCTMLQTRPDESSIRSSMCLGVFEKIRIVEVNSFQAV